MVEELLEEVAISDQVQDDPDLLDLMMADLNHASDLYKPTNYWKVYENTFLPELRRLGLHDFRRRSRSVLSSFGATDLSPELPKIDVNRHRLINNKVTRRIPGWSRLSASINGVINKADLLISDTYGCSLDDLKFAAYHTAKMFGQLAGARSIEEFSISKAGNPSDVLEIGGRSYTMRSLYYYMRYAYCCKFIDFDKVNVIAELGAGSGKQVEVIRKLHSKVCYLIFDISPQLYVCEQLLKSIFPGSVVSYRITREPGFVIKPQPGQIYILGSWRFPLIETVNVDLFWNAVSFQEMEPDIVLNYLGFVNRCAGHVFLQQMMQGKNVAAAPGCPGVLKQTEIRHYRQGLSHFELIDLSSCVRPLGILHGHSDSFWRRSANPI
jgi:putative sugar O-methyltransferase